MENPNYPIMRFFDYEHLPPHLQQVSTHFADLAEAMAEMFSVENVEHLFADSSYEAYVSEVTKGLDKLLEAKDCFVRARVAKENK